MLAVIQTVSHQVLIGGDYSGICLVGLWMTTDCKSDYITSNDEINWKGCGKHEA